LRSPAADFTASRAQPGPQGATRPRPLPDCPPQNALPGTPGRGPHCP
jgi:hypothetical protein